MRKRKKKSFEIIQIGTHHYRFYNLTCPVCKKIFQNRQWDIVCCGEECRKKYLSNLYKNRKFTTEWKEKISKAKLGNKCGLGTKLTQEQKNAIRDRMIGDKNPQWKGGITSFIYRIRQLKQYKKWKEAILKRDYPLFTPKEIKRFQIQVHHIESVKNLIDKNNLTTIEEVIKTDKFWDINNGIALRKGEHFLITQLERIKYPSPGFIQYLNWFLTEIAPKYVFTYKRNKTGKIYKEYLYPEKQNYVPKVTMKTKAIDG